MLESIIMENDDNRCLIMSEIDRPYREDETQPKRTYEDDVFAEYIWNKYNLRLAESSRN